MQKDYDFLIRLSLTSSELYPNLENLAIVSNGFSANYLIIIMHLNISNS